MNRAATGTKPGNNRNEAKSLSWQAASKHLVTTWLLRGHYKVRSRFGFATFRIFHEWLKFRADTRIILVTYAAWLRSRLVSLRFEFFMNGSSFETILGSFRSRMLRGCVPDSVSLRFEFSFMNGSSFDRYSNHFGRVCYVVAFRFYSVSNLVSEWLKFRVCSDHFGVAMLAVRQELESQVRQACCVRSSCMLERLRRMLQEPTCFRDAFPAYDISEH